MIFILINTKAQTGGIDVRLYRFFQRTNPLCDIIIYSAYPIFKRFYKIHFNTKNYICQLFLKNMY